MAELSPALQTQLRQLLVTAFDSNELDVLCVDLVGDSEVVPGAKEDKVMRATRIIQYFDNRGRILAVMTWCYQQRQNLRGELDRLRQQILPARFFISYRRNSADDNQLAHYLHETLTALGHSVFIDTTMRTGAAWLDEIDRQIKDSDFLIVLLSQNSVDSEMVKSEVQRASEYRKLQNKPQTLPVRMAFEGLLPYSLGAFLNPLQYVVWANADDNARVRDEVLAALAGALPDQAAVAPTLNAPDVIVTDDGRIARETTTLSAPLPQFDPRFLDELETPGGTVKLKDALYVLREADERLKREVAKEGTTTTIRAARQTGKSSLLIRGVQHAKGKGAKEIIFDFQRLDSDQLASADVLLRHLAEVMVRKLRVNVEVEKEWRGALSPQDKLTNLLGDVILPQMDTPVVLALDEADRLLGQPFSKDFFGLLRAWHNNRAYEEQWNKLNLVLVISTEPYLLIPDATQSPFNVGMVLDLKDFNATQVSDLNRKHGSPLREADLPAFMALLGGQPYLTRKALYTLVTEKMRWADLVQSAASDSGPFNDHLRHHYWLLRNEPQLREALKGIIRQSQCRDDILFHRLLQAGLVKGSGDVCECRCGLYAGYFRDKL
jgi:AAA-like domain/TIR domain